MADVAAQGIPDFGNLLTSFPRNQAGIGLTQAQTGQTQASTGLMGAQTGLVQMQTQRAALEIQMIKDAMQSQPQDTSQNDQSGVDPTETGIASSLNKKMYVDPMGPPELRRFLNPALAAALPQVVQRADEVRKIAVDAQNSRNQNEANDIFQTSSTLAQGDMTHPLQSLLSLRQGSYLSNVGKAINSMQDKSPDEKDEMAKTAINAAAKYSHQYTGRKPVPQGDEFRDEATGFPVYAPKIGPTAGEKIGLGEWSNNWQKATFDNRETSIRPKDLGIHSYQDLVNYQNSHPNVKFSNLPSSTQAQGSQQPPAAAPQKTNLSIGQNAKPGTPQAAAQDQALSSAGLSQDQVQFVKDQPPGIPGIKGNEQLNPYDIKQRDIYLKQREDLAKNTNLEYSRAQDTVTHIKQIQALLNTPGLTLGPGSQQYSQMETFLNQWFGTSTGQAGAYQVLTKVLNASEMNDLLQQFHSEGAQVRLGAYESRLIMEKLAANPSLTKEAIQQMLQWQGSDAQYTMNKAKVAGALATSGKSVENFDKNYGDTFKKQDIVDSTLTSLHPTMKFDKVKGNTYPAAEVKAVAAKQGIPLAIFQDQLIKAGAKIE